MALVNQSLRYGNKSTASFHMFFLLFITREKVSSYRSQILACTFYYMQYLILTYQASCFLDVNSIYVRGSGVDIDCLLLVSSHCILRLKFGSSHIQLK